MRNRYRRPQPPTSDLWTAQNIVPVLFCLQFLYSIGAETTGQVTSQIRQIQIRERSSFRPGYSERSAEPTIRAAARILTPNVRVCAPPLARTIRVNQFFRLDVAQQIQNPQHAFLA